MRQILKYIICRTEGTMNDPEDLPGLTNLLGYTLLWGNRKYRQKFEFIEFVKSNGGFIDHFPFLTENKTRFSFKINFAHLELALDKFSFISNPN